MSLRDGLKNIGKKAAGLSSGKRSRGSSLSGREGIDPSPVAVEWEGRRRGYVKESPSSGELRDEIDRERGKLNSARIAALSDDATFHHEDALDDAFDRQVTEGRQRLARPRPQQFVTGLMGGVEIGLGVVLGMAVTHVSGSQLLGGLAFSLGFVTLLLAHSELFTEGFLVPTFAVIARRARFSQLLRFWFYTFLGNLLGGFGVMWFAVTALPVQHDTFRAFGEHFAGIGPSLDTCLLAIIAGTSITLMTRMQMGTQEVVGKIAAAVFGGMLLFGVGLLHSVLDTLIMFGAWFAGSPAVSALGIVKFLWWVIPLNMAGGIIGVAIPRAVQSKDRVKIERLRVASEMLDGNELANDARGALITGREVRKELEEEIRKQREEVAVEEEPQEQPNSVFASRILSGLRGLAQIRQEIVRNRLTSKADSAVQHSPSIRGHEGNDAIAEVESGAGEHEVIEGTVVTEDEDFSSEEDHNSREAEKIRREREEHERKIERERMREAHEQAEHERKMERRAQRAAFEQAEREWKLEKERLEMELKLQKKEAQQAYKELKDARELFEKRRSEK